MKKLVILALALITFQANAQDKKEVSKERKEKMMQLEPQEMAELQTKKMTLHLDLTEAQQKKVMELNLEQAKQRKAAMKKRMEAREKGEKPTKEQRLLFENKKLDAQIENKKKMKNILNDEQYKKWETMLEKRAHKKVEIRENMRREKRMEEKKMQKELSND